MKSVPPLLAITRARRARPRKPHVHRPLEQSIHFAVVDALRQLCAPDWRWSHFPAGEARDARTGAKLKRMGTKPGWPDFVLISPRGMFHALELKRLGGSLSDDQQGFQTWCIAHGVPHGVAYSLDDALAIFCHWGCLRSKV